VTIAPNWRKCWNETQFSGTQIFSEPEVELSEIALAGNIHAKPALKQRLVGILRLTVAATMILGSAGHMTARYLSAPPDDTLSIVGLSDQAIVSLLRSGKTVALLSAVPAGPAALDIAEAMGNAVVGPTIDTSKGDGSKGLAAALEQAARTMKAKGFRGVAFVGDGHEARRAQAQVAEKLGHEWAGSRTRVLDAGDYPIATKAELIKRVMTRLDA
jgi:hypothetical protein